MIISTFRNWLGLNNKLVWRFEIPSLPRLRCQGDTGKSGNYKVNYEWWLHGLFENKMASVFAMKRLSFDVFSLREKLKGVESWKKLSQNRSQNRSGYLFHRILATSCWKIGVLNWREIMREMQHFEYLLTIRSVEFGSKMTLLILCVIRKNKSATGVFFGCFNQA